MAIINSSRDVALTSEYLNLPITTGIDDGGHWYYYIPVNANNTSKLSSIGIYKWDTKLSVAGTGNLIIDGSMPLITENWANANIKYHGGSIENIGPGINNVNGVDESDAFFFGHLGATTTSPSDDVFYWDRAYIAVADTDWQYFPYHQHSPTNYVNYENGRQTISGDGFIDPTDKAFAYQISTRVRVSSVDYASVLARIHTPSVGGAHNSHNDVTLPTTANQNYMPCGILKGIGERFHAFYITSSGSDWEIFNRTYLDSSTSFTTQVSLGIYNLADPSFTPSSNIQNRYPIRAACGASFGARIYIPVILNNASSGFDLEIWSFNSLDTIAGGSLVRQVLASGVSTRPDCYCLAFGTTALYVLISDITNGGYRLWKFSSNTWSDQGAFLTNSAAAPLRIHGFKFDSNSFKFYALLSGTASGGGTYLGPGLYSFELDDAFLGYPHLSYDYTTNSFIEQGALTTGYVKYTPSTASYVQVASTEPQAIPSDTLVLDYNPPPNQFFNRKSVGFGGKDYYFQTITLRDGRRVGVGQIIGNPENSSITNAGDLLFSIYSADLNSSIHLSTLGAGDDQLTGVWQGSDSKVWVTGYTKSELVPKGNIWVHGWCRNLSDGGNQIQWVDIARDSDGNFYTVGSQDSGWVVLAKYDKNYNLVWQKNIGDDTSFTDVAKGVAIDSTGNIYIAGSSQEAGQGLNDALLIKFSDAGDVLWAKTYGTAADQTATSITVVQQGGVDNIVLSVLQNTDTTFVTLDTEGLITSQNIVTDLMVSRVRPDQSNSNVGRFLFAGNAGINQGENYTITNQGTNNYVWNGGIYSNTTDPSPVTLYRGETYTFTINASGHPFWIKTAQVTGNGSAYNSGVTNNGTEVGTITFTVPLDAPSTLYYVCQYHIGMSGQFQVLDNPTLAKFGLCEINGTPKAVKWVSTYLGSSLTTAYDIANIDAAVSGNAAGYVICGVDGSSGLLIKVSVDELSGNFTINKTWDKLIANSTLRAMSVSSYTDTDRYVWTVGSTDNSNIAVMGMNEGLMVKWSSNTGTVGYQNVFGHDMDENWLSVINDVTGHNIVTAGWSESHSSSRDAVLFRSSKLGYGTGTYNLTDTGTAPYYYNASNISLSNASGTLSNLTAPNNSSSITVTDVYNVYTENSGYLSRNFDGAFGPNGVYGMIIGCLDLELLQTWLNTDEYQQAVERGDRVFYFSNIAQIGKMYQIGTVGDASADDGSIFGYDIIEHSNGEIYAIGQTSGDIAKTNLGLSGVYDYLLVEVNPATDELEFYQNGTDRDEETYALTELSDGRIAYVGRTSGNIASPNYGGYDIFLGLFDTETGLSDYYSIGSGLDDAAQNVHDLGNNVLAISYVTFGTLGNATTAGSQDIGVIKFNYSTDTWGNAYQTGSSTSELTLQNGKMSAKLSNDRIAVVASSTGIFADDAVTYGFLDLCMAILNLQTETWTKFQIGTTANEVASSVSSFADILLISGYSGGSFTDQEDAIFVEFNALEGILGRSSSLS